MVLWASQTGNAEEFATTVGGRLTAAGHPTTVRDMADCAPHTLPSGADLLVISSTFGDGDAPDNGTGFWQALSAADAARFADLRCAVLAFGDSSHAADRALREIACTHGGLSEEEAAAHLKQLAAERRYSRDVY